MSEKSLGQFTTNQQHFLTNTPVEETPAEAAATQEEVVEQPAEVVDQVDAYNKYMLAFIDFKFATTIIDKYTEKSYEEARQNLKSLIKTHFDDA